MENKWTQEQIDEAAKRTRDAYVDAKWSYSQNENFEYWRKVVLAAQMPIAPIADEEMYEVLQDTPYASISEQFIVAANKVIARRNAPPKPDLLDRIIEELTDYNGAVVDVAKRILAIVKEQQ